MGRACQFGDMSCSSHLSPDNDIFVASKFYFVIFFAACFCVATIRGWHLFPRDINNGWIRHVRAIQ